MTPFPLLVKHTPPSEAAPAERRRIFARFHRHYPQKHHRDAISHHQSTLTYSTCNNTSNHTACKCLAKGTFSSFGATCEQAPSSSIVAISALDTIGDDTNEIDGLVLEPHSNYFSNPNHINMVQEGGVLFSFSCTHACDDNSFEQEALTCIANLSSFDDEARDNGVPHYNAGDDYTFVFSRCSYLLPGVDIDKLTPEYLASEAYHKACQPNGTRVWESNKNKTTFRITKPVIPYLFILTVQFKASKIEKDDLEKLSVLAETRVDYGLLLERTKRNPNRQDSTRKAKSVLLYTRVEGGILVNHVTVILQSSLPLIIAMAINKFGSWGLGEACETVVKTRQYTRRTIPMATDNHQGVIGGVREEAN